MPTRKSSLGSASGSGTRVGGALDDGAAHEDEEVGRRVLPIDHHRPARRRHDRQRLALRSKARFLAWRRVVAEQPDGPRPAKIKAAPLERRAHPLGVFARLAQDAADSPRLMRRTRADRTRVLVPGGGEEHEFRRLPPLEVDDLDHVAGLDRDDDHAAAVDHIALDTGVKRAQPWLEHLRAKRRYHCRGIRHRVLRGADLTQLNHS
jgi:hypothetical protein